MLRRASSKPPSGAFANLEFTSMGPIATVAMADEGSCDASSRKLHPFFVKTPAYADTQPPEPSFQGHDAKRARIDEYAPHQGHGYMDSQPMYYDPNLQHFQQPINYSEPYQQTMMGYVNPPQYANPQPQPMYYEMPQSTAPIYNTPMPATAPGSSYAPMFNGMGHAPAPPAPVAFDPALVPMPVQPEFTAALTGPPAPPAPMFAPSHHIHAPPTEHPAPPAPIFAPSHHVHAPLAPIPTPATPVNPPQPPKKVLKFNMKTGTLGSPPKPKPTKRNSKIVYIKYGLTPEDRMRIGEKISKILAGELVIQETSAKPAESKPRKSAKEQPQATPKTTHPFFAKEKRVEQQPSADKKRNTVFMSTPVSPKKPRNTFTSGKGPSFGIKSTGTKVPGAKHPLWPPLGFSHVRGEDQMQPPPADPGVDRLKKKSKGQTVTINVQESILGELSRQLDIQNVKRNLPKNDNTFPPPPAELRLPTRHFESGRQLAKRIRTEIQSKLPPLTASTQYMEEDELSQEPSKPAHPAVERHWLSLYKELSAFDRSTCENASWSSKYAPVTAAQVLQPGKEVMLLKQWLELLRVQGVESAGDGSAKAKGEKKKKRKSKLDGFVVDSEDESGEMNELSDLEDQSPSAKQRSRPSVARSLDLTGKDPSKLANTILISGPHGCGKSASVYAVAKELGFEVFEINSSTRRSGKDILEKVGDMTRNHLVQHHRPESATDSAEATEAEVSSGKQGMMTSFFKPKAEKRKSSQDKPRKKTEQKSSSKSQKQSLILLEEVDVLYEEDKQFWASLQSLMSQSKRPFILTCNDESAVPINTLDLHGIFRFLPPPENLAIDTCLLIAANEGHALKRHAVKSLYKCRDYDLRATLADLHFWCQIGVGDRRGGHDWFYLRWPKGIDIDKSGDVVRVISEDTYQAGMGWLSRDRIITALNTQFMEQEAAEQSWHFWHQDLADWHCEEDLKSLSKAVSTSTRQQNAEALGSYADYYDTLSCADLCASGVFGVELQELIDPTLPEMPEGARDDYTIAQALLEADPVQPHFCSRVGISSAVSTLALESLKNSVSAHTASSQLKDQFYDEQQTTRMLEKSAERENSKLTRYDVAVAFDPIAVSPKAMASMSLDPSVFDRTMTLIVLEVAPWVRGIVHYEDQLMQDRQRLNDLLSEGGGRKRMRTTRSAYSALEGGERRTTRRERYFGDCLSTEAVMYTAGKDWQEALPQDLTEQYEGASSSPAAAMEDAEMIN